MKIVIKRKSNQTYCVCRSAVDGEMTSNVVVDCEEAIYEDPLLLLEV